MLMHHPPTLPYHSSDDDDVRAHRLLDEERLQESNEEHRQVEVVRHARPVERVRVERTAQHDGARKRAEYRHVEHVPHVAEIRHHLVQPRPGLLRCDLKHRVPHRNDVLHRQKTSVINN